LGWKQGQSSVEAIIVGTVLLGLLLATFANIIQRNQDIDRFSGMEKDRQNCNSIASKITAINSSKGYSEAKMMALEEEARVENGGVVVGNASCSYTGEARRQDSETGFAEDKPGFDLEQGVVYLVKELEGRAVFCVHGEDWC